jgi:hypothetical protein
MRENKDIFTNKREFLTKLREVRQKCMNTTGLKLSDSQSQQQL